MRSVTSKTLIFLGGIIVALVVSEAGVRLLKIAPVVLDADISYRHYFVDDATICYKMMPQANKEINAEGFRGRDFSLAKAEDSVRIIMLGDSITYGSYTSKDSFPEVLEELLNTRIRTLSLPLRYEVMNFGVGGYNIVSEVGVLKAYGLKYKPDIVILNYFWNDNDLYSFNYWSFLKRQDAADAEKEWARQYYSDPDSLRLKRLLLRSHLFAFIWDRIGVLKGHQPGPDRIGYGTYKNDIVSQKIAELKRMAADNNFRLIVFMHPILDYDRNQPHANYAKTKKACDELGIACIDLLKYYKEESGDPEVFLANKGDLFHPNSRGYNLIARSILSEFIQRGYVASDK
jgi:hypothetical protein